MKKNSKNLEDRKPKSFKRFIKSFHYCAEGMRYSFYNEQNIVVMFFFAIVAMILGIFLKISYIESLIIAVLIGVNMALEMINTAIEEVVDLVTQENNDKAKNAKDCASAAVGISAIFAFIIGAIIFLPKIIELF